MRLFQYLIPVLVIIASSPAGVAAAIENPAHTSLFAGAAVAPLNHDFEVFHDEREGSVDTSLGAASRLGLIPNTIDLSHNAGIRIDDIPTSAIIQASSGGDPTTPIGTSGSSPSRYDLRDLGRMSPVKDQGQCGACWAFSSSAALESNLLPAESWDFSENNMKSLSGYDLSACSGGNSVMATAYFTRWDGPVRESDDPYSETDQGAIQAAARKHVQNVLFLPARGDSLDNDNVKRVLRYYGAVYSTVAYGDSYYDSKNASYYYGGSSPANHAITIAGWDDSYPKERFRRIPPGDGAFIVKNSWGSKWGDGGYFYVSYYDTQIAKEIAAFTGDSRANYKSIYQYDPLGWVGNFGFGTTDAWFANVFTATGEEDVVAAGFYAPSANSEYSVYVYREPENGAVSSVGALASGHGTIKTPGYYTVPVSSPVRVREGMKFSVAVYLSTPGYPYPVAIEYPINGFSGQASAQPGQSYVSTDGVTWRDLTDSTPSANVCLKAFATGPGSGSSGTTGTTTFTVSGTSTSNPVQIAGALGYGNNLTRVQQSALTSKTAGNGSDGTPASGTSAGYRMARNYLESYTRGLSWGVSLRNPS